MSDWVRVTTVEECPPGSLRSAMVGPDPVVVANVDGEFFALRDQCSHEDLPLSDGEIEGPVVVCMYHGARFDLASGAPRGLPAVKPVKRFDVEVRGDEVFVRKN